MLRWKGFHEFKFIESRRRHNDPELERIQLYVENKKAEESAFRFIYEFVEEKETKEDGQRVPRLQRKGTGVLNVSRALQEVNSNVWRLTAN